MRWFALFSDNKSEAQRKGIWFLPNSQLLCSRVRSLAGSFGGFIRPLLLYAVGFSLQPCTLCWFCWQVPCAFGGTGTPYTCIWEGPPPPPHPGCSLLQTPPACYCTLEIRSSAFWHLISPLCAAAVFPPLSSPLFAFLFCLSFSLLIFLFWPPCGLWSSQARDHI